MSQLIQWLSNNPVVSVWITIISSIGFLVTVTAFVVQMKDRRKKILCYTISSTLLFDKCISQIDGVSLFYQNAPIESLSVSNIRIWNAGNEIVHESDFYPENELKVIIPVDEQILAVSKLKDMANTSKSKVSQGEINELNINFYCYEPKQGVSITLYHTCVLEKAIRLSGKIKNGKLLNKSIEINYIDGEFFIETPLYRISFNNFLFRLPFRFLSSFGISTKRKK